MQTHPVVRLGSNRRHPENKPEFSLAGFSSLTPHTNYYIIIYYYIHYYYTVITPFLHIITLAIIMHYYKFIITSSLHHYYILGNNMPNLTRKCQCSSFQLGWTFQYVPVVEICNCVLYGVAGTDKQPSRDPSHY